MASEVSTTCVSGWVHRSIRVDCSIHPLSQVVLTSSLMSNRSRPLRHLVHYRFVNRLLRNARALRNFERMIAAFNDIQRCRQAMLLDYCANLVGSAERIARALREQHRRANLLQVLIAQLVGPARRMQRIAKKTQARNAITLCCCNLRTDPSAHRLAANDQTILVELSMIQNRIDYRAIAGLKSRLRIGNAPPTLGVKKIESYCVNSAPCQTAGYHAHKTAQLIRTRAVPEHAGKPGAVLPVG